MRRLIQLLVAASCVAAFASPAPARGTAHHLLPEKITLANTVYVDCVCPRALGVAKETALQQLLKWGRFQIAENHRHADLIILFSGNPYLGDYLTRDGPDTRPVQIVSTIMTVIDPTTGAALWTDSRRWGSLRVKGATKDLIDELHDQMVAQTARWTLNDVLICSVTPVYAGFAHLTPDEALAKSDPAENVSGTADHMMLSSADAPGFCKRVQAIFGSDSRIVGFDVDATQEDELDVSNILQHADGFNFNGGKFNDGGQVYFTAQSKDKRILIQYQMVAHRLVLARVSFYY